jgi:hypothetical protein
MFVGVKKEEWKLRNKISVHRVRNLPRSGPLKGRSVRRWILIRWSSCHLLIPNYQSKISIGLSENKRTLWCWRGVISFQRSLKFHDNEINFSKIIKRKKLDIFSSRIKLVRLSSIQTTSKKPTTYCGCWDMNLNLFSPKQVSKCWSLIWSHTNDNFKSLKDSSFDFSRHFIQKKSIEGHGTQSGHHSNSHWIFCRRWKSYNCAKFSNGFTSFYQCKKHFLFSFIIIWISKSKYENMTMWQSNFE